MLTPTKNLTPRQIATNAAGAVALVVALVLLVVWLLPGPDFSVWLFLMPPLVYVVAYQLFLRSLDHYIYRKIKLIYKTIHSQKVSTEVKASGLNLNRPIIDDVEEEVAQWADREEEQLGQYERFAEYRRRYVGDISHELKTPIFNIQGYLHTLIEGGYNDEKISMKFLKKAAKNVERLQTIVEDLSAISRLESGELMLDFDTFDLRVLTDEVFEELDLKSRETKVELAYKDGHDFKVLVRADRESIRQVLINLVTNSIKYGNAAGATKVGFYDMETYILCEVADNGIGIPEKHLPHVFDRFYRVDKSRSRKKGGSGLGLSIVKHIIEAHQQTINVRSTPGLGSTFGFTLAKG